MYLILCFLLAFTYEFSEGSPPGQLYPASKGEIWPKPFFQDRSDSYYTFTSAAISIDEKHHKCKFLKDIVHRYLNYYKMVDQKRRKLNEFYNSNAYTELPEKNNSLNFGSISHIIVTLQKPCEEFPYFGMDESYILDVSVNVSIRSDSVWGIMRGLESFAHSAYFNDDFTEIRINATRIMDKPRFPHRGVLLDTSRHHLAVRNILKTLDAMAMNKMNVLHWHIVDDQSFPYVSEKFPELSGRGAYLRELNYTKKDIKRIVEAARMRGIRVLPEFDVPGHTASWGLSHPEVLTKCYVDGKSEYLGPMNPIEKKTYELLGELFKEVQEWFPDKHFHFGGDEVLYDCWASNPEIKAYMQEHNMTSEGQLHNLFMQSLLPLMNNYTKTIVWEEAFSIGVDLPKESLVQVWKDNGADKLKEVLNAGHQALFSSKWYLDHLEKDWVSLYNVDPQALVGDDALAKNLAGGEACMWGELVTDANVISRVWPRASAVAERLWSPLEATPFVEAPSYTHNRLEEHTCRMLRHGVNAKPPNGPGICIH